MPLLPEVIVTQEALLVAVQLQPVEVVTFIVPDPPDALNDWLLGEME